MTESDFNPREEAHKLVTHLLKLKDDRGAMASLRKGLSPTTEHYAWPYVARWCDLRSDKARRITSTVAGCFASHPSEEHHSSRRENLGEVIRRLALGDQSGDDALRSFEGRFRRLLSCDSSLELCERVPAVARAAAQRSIPIDYARLYTDLWYWSDRTRVDWAASYWGVPSTEGADS